MRDALNTARTRRYTIGGILTGKATRTAADVSAVAAFVAASSLTAFDGATFGLFDAAVADDSCSITSGAAVLTSPNNPWTAADVGKAIDVQGAGAAGATLRTYISAFTSAGSVTLGANAGTTVAATVSSTSGLAIWGNLLNLSRNLPIRTNEAGTSESAASTIVETAVNVKTVGAVGDGVTDDTAALQRALNTSQRIYLPRGTYLITATLDPANVNQWILGDGTNQSGGSVIKWGGAVSSTMMKAPGGASRIDGIRFDGGNIAGVSGVVCDDTHRPGYADWGFTRFYQCLGIGFDCSVSNPGGTNGIYYNNFGHMTAEQCGKGVRLATLVAASARVNANSWKHLVVQTSVTLGLEINRADGNTWNYCDAEGNLSVGIDVVEGNYNVIFGGWLEGNTTWHLRVANNPTVTAFEYFGACTQDSKISYTNNNNRSLVLPTKNSYHKYLAGRWFAEMLQMQDYAGGNLATLNPNSIAFNRSSSAGMSFIDQSNTTLGTGIALRVSRSGASDTQVIAVDNNAVGGQIGFFDKAAAGTPVPQPTGYGTPTGTAKLANFPGATATLAQTSGALADLLNQLKGFGLLGA